MCSNCPGIKLEQALGAQEDKIEHLSSYADVVHTTAKQVISRRRRNENVFKMSKDEICTCKACKNTVFHCQICKFVGFLLPSSSWLLKLPNCRNAKLHFQMTFSLPSPSYLLKQPRSGSPICLIRSMITDRTGRRKVLLPINHNHYNFRENKCIAFPVKEL